MKRPGRAAKEKPKKDIWECFPAELYVDNSQRLASEVTAYRDENDVTDDLFGVYKLAEVRRVVRVRTVEVVSTGKGKKE